MTQQAIGMPRNYGRTAMIAAAVALGAFGMGFAAVPLYRVFCQKTGFGGTAQRAYGMEGVKAVPGKTISVRFDANVAPGMPWMFRPEHPTQTVEIGKKSMAIFLARNDSDKPVTGSAVFNVSPDEAGFYFVKIQCFCFNRQTLAPHQEVRMPVIYYVDPKILQDEDAKKIEQITLSYTFNPVEQDGKPD